jgi:hypothetical protein
MADPKTCTYGIDCPRPANAATGRCDLHDAMMLAEEARDLLMKVLVRLDVLERRGREVERCESPNGNPQSSPEAGTSGEGLCPAELSERSTEEEQCCPR